MGDIFNGKEKALIGAILTFFITLVQQLTAGNGTIVIDPSQVGEIGNIVGEMVVSGITALITYAGVYFFPNTGFQRVEEPSAITKEEAAGYPDPAKFPEVNL